MKSNSDEMTIREAAEKLGVSISTVRGYIREGKIDSELRRRGRMQVRYIPVEELNRLSSESGQTLSNPVEGVDSDKPDQTSSANMVKPANDRLEIQDLNRLETVMERLSDFNGSRRRESSAYRRAADEFWKLIENALKRLNRRFFRE